MIELVSSLVVFFRLALGQGDAGQMVFLREQRVEAGLVADQMGYRWRTVGHCLRL
jgi:hypothetical protein